MSVQQSIKCPKCKFEIPLNETIAKQTEEALREKINDEVSKKTIELDRQSDYLKKRASELDSMQETISDKVEYELNIERNKIRDTERIKLLEEQEEKTKAIQEELKQKRDQLNEASKRELTLIQEQRTLEDEKSNLELTVQRKLSEERASIFEQASKQAAEEQLLKINAKDSLLDTMRSQIEELKRRSEVGSQEAQGEALEGQLQEVLQQTFQYDKFAEVKKGIKGGDIIQTVFSATGKNCGTILWETKNTKTFTQDWITKLKKDQQDAKADLSILMTIAMPKEIESCGLYKDVWITNYKASIGVATALRHSLLEVARQQMVTAGKTSTKGLIYDYVTSKEFAMHIKLVVAAFVKMQEELGAEKRAITRIWKKRETQLSTVIENISGMRGSIEGISQKALPDVDISLEEIGDSND